MTSSQSTEPIRTDPECLFCKIVAGTVPATIVAQTPEAIAFRDINPQAPMHVLVVPREHYGDIAQLAAGDPGLLAGVVALSDQIAGDLADGQYRLIFNSGPHAGQSVFHVHGHVIGGARLGWSPA
ncbi:histidine triad (HIT) family protein [Sanguibacter gelidistatuariae]|uniref:Histidine triad (HIT) family protein n=1 Tax=Sanguibacter gelidistatuariae TaxID=1814289 RepID=A0A1G6RYT3_9MICO|nr:histidine triad nucleotide-binding protein [Sanguibacter gelidistatuariae]SDD09581.1 histidine triad (HIT) family protein [Sanguibacter gelidistatuariae]